MLEFLAVLKTFAYIIALLNYMLASESPRHEVFAIKS